MQLARLGPTLLLLFSSFYQSTCRGSASSAPAPSASGVEEVSLPGVDTGALTSRERREWSTYVSELLAPCPDQPVSIAQCVKEGRNCSKCLPAAQLVLKEVRDGKSRSQVEDAFYARFSPDRIKPLDLSDAPVFGPPSAPVTIVEFADFECPHCKHAYPVLEKAVTDHAGKARLVFKFYPLSGHVHGESAARAAVAAMRQGKFWEMHHALFENQTALEERDIEKYAKQIGLDMAKFKADWGSEATADRVARDRKEGDKLGLSGTPSIYVDGREFSLSTFDLGSDLDDWIESDARALAAPSPSPAAAGSSTARRTPENKEKAIP